MIIINDKLIKEEKFHVPFLEKEIPSESLKSLVEKFNQNIQDGLIEFEEVPCLCGNNTFDLLSSVETNSIIQKIVMCKKCGLIQSNPRYSEEAFRDFLESDFYKCLYFSGNLENYSHSKFNIDTGASIFETVNKVIDINENTKVLEIGCAAGWNLLPFKNRNAKILGLDYNNKFIDIGRSIGLNLKHITNFEYNEKFDVIIFNKVFNLFLQPLQLLRKIKDLLTENGILYFNILNLEKFDFKRLKNIRINYFTIHSLNFFLSQCGFKRLTYKKLDESYCYTIYKKGITNINPEKFFRKNLKKTKRSIKSFILKSKLKNILKSRKNVSTSGI